MSLHRSCALLLSCMLCLQTTVEAVRTIELYMVCDKACYTSLTQWEGNAEQFLYNAVHRANKPYVALNTRLVLVGLELWNQENLINDTVPSQASLLANFKPYRQHVQLPRIWSDVSIIVTGLEITSNDVNGMMSFGGMCAKSEGSGLLRYNRNILNSFALTLAHEVGHSLSMRHDSSGNTCCLPSALSCVMAPSPSVHSIMYPAFSECSVREFNNFVSSAKSGCMRDQPKQSYVPPGSDACGNGVVDAGEACDCGQGCLDNCCNCCTPQCTLKPTAQCTSGACCDVSTCQIRPAAAGYVCRHSTDVICDVTDVCNGFSTQCPDVYNADGTLCRDRTNVPGYCKHGACNTGTYQCNKEWNTDYVQGAAQCYTASINKASKYGNCGVTSGGYFTSCTYGSQRNYKCGMLECTGPRSLSALNSRKQPRRNPLVRSNVCVSGQHSPWSGQVGQVMVADGTKCGQDKACLGTNCINWRQAFAAISNVTAPVPSTALCGNGVIEAGEQCDCGPKQCDCCDRCQLVPSGGECLYQKCRGCDGVSTQCSSVTASRDHTPCGSRGGLCTAGRCVTADASCKKYYGQTATVAPPAQYALNNDTTSSHNGGGYLAYEPKKRKWPKQLRTLVPAGGNGMCGILLCTTRRKGSYVDASGKALTTVTFGASTGTGLRIMYYKVESLYRGPKMYYKYFPVLTEDGTACQINGRNGYCATDFLQMDDWTWFIESHCLPI